MVPRDGLAALKTSGEKRVTAERHERPPPEAPGRWSGGETAGTDTGGRPERVETGPPSDGGGITASACGECGRDRDMDKRKQRWRHSDGKAQQEDAARRPEIETSESTGRKGRWLGETETARGESLHAAPKSGEQASQPQPRGKSCGASGDQRPERGEHAGSPRDEGSETGDGSAELVSSDRRSVRPPTGLFYRKRPPQLYATHRKSDERRKRHCTKYTGLRPH
jgi:hypothetical protein